MSHTIVVTGATGKQGGSVLRALLDHRSSSPTDLTIYAVTRTPDSPAARALTSRYPQVRLLKGNLAAPADLVRAIPAASKSSWSIYIVSNPGEREVLEATALIDAAIGAGVSHIVYSSVDRGASNGGNNPSPVHHWQSKHEIEAHLRAVCAATTDTASTTNTTDQQSRVTYTIIRPVFLLDNLALPGFYGKLSATLWASFISPRPLKVVDPADIGAVAAAALLDPASRLHRRNTELSLCGDELTFERADEIFRERVGHSMPTTSKWLVNAVLFLARDFGRMTEALAKQGFGAPVGGGESGVKMSDFGTWLGRSRFVEGRSA